MSTPKVLPDLHKRMDVQSSEAMRRAFRDRMAGALRRRLKPNTMLQKTQLAHALGVSVQTIDNWCGAVSQPDGFMLVQMIHFFDTAFAVEVFGQGALIVSKIDDARRYAALREINRTAPVLAALDAVLSDSEVA